ncbi:MAG: sulfatase-like hydrolase/transferase [Phycisphaeraceae bacterium]|nr:sulfatase-like hydrolase/transferase [Phycisphaeraceae bacterium]
MTDQQHIDTLSAGGCAHVKTPAMDSLMHRGVSFTQSYSTNPVCSPARSSAFTGRMSTETGVVSNGKHIREDIPNIGQWFSDMTSYETVYAGKWHVPRTHTLDIKGFRVINTGIGGHGILGDATTSRACEGFLRNRAKDKPFLMVASFMQPHDICEWLRLNTYDPKRLAYEGLAAKLPPLPKNFDTHHEEPDYLKKIRNSRDPFVRGWEELQWQYYLWSYYRHIEQVDAEIGRVLQALNDEGDAENTLVVFTSDHGEGLGHHQMVRKSSPYDESSKVPMVVSLPGQCQENVINRSHLVSGADIVPTICDFAGIKSPKDMRGISMKPWLQGDSTRARDFVVTELPSNRARMLRTKDYKYITYADDPVDMLFNMTTDPGETRNLAADSSHATVLSDLKKTLTDWERHLDVAPNMPNADAWWRRGRV